MKALLMEIVKQLVDFPGEVAVNEVKGERLLVLELSVAKPDIGITIGTKGRTIAAIRTVMNAASIKVRKRVIVQLVT